MKSDILIIEDEAEIREILCEIIGDAGFHVEAVPSAIEALERLKDIENIPPLLLCDISMPKMSGLEFVKKLREAGTPVAIVMLTAHHDKDKIIEALQLGALDYVVKPFRPPELLERIAGWLEFGRRMRKLQADAAGNGEGLTPAHHLRMLELFRLQNHKKTKESGEAA